MDKINIYVPQNIGDQIVSDANLFEIFKNDGKSINTNRFLGKLITGYYDDYENERQLAYRSIISTLEGKKLSEEDKEQIANNIIHNVILPHVPSRKGKHPKRLSLKPTKDTEFLIEQIIRDTSDQDFISQYFCKMIMSYCEKPFSIRERILFKENYEKLILACDTKVSISFKTIWNPEQIHEVIPFRVVTGTEEMFNYLLCAEVDPETHFQAARAYRLNRIGKLRIGKNFYAIDADIEKRLIKMTQYGPQYAINDDNEVIVRLTPKGELTYKRVYWGRPQPIKITANGEYYFDCSLDQVYLYFRRFGDDAEIIKPYTLRERIIAFHKDALKVYKE